MRLPRHLVFNLIPIDPAISGGIATVCQTMVHHIPEGAPDTSTWVLTGGQDWSGSFPLAGRFEVLDFPGKASRTAGASLAGHLAPGIPGGVFPKLWARLRRRDPAFPAGLAAGTVVHCPYQILHPKPGRHWNLPYVINLHDIQHVHFPEFFSAKDLARRQARYLASATVAQAVCVVDEWTRRDLLAHLPIPESKVFVAPFGPTWGSVAPLTAAGRHALLARYGLPEAFAFYPAQTWPHKNHLRLLEALALLAGRGVHIPLVCTGHINDHGRQVIAKAEALGLGDRVQFLGLIPGEHIQALYQAARMTVIPSLFEGGSGIPVLESMALGSPLAASAACGIPDAVGDAGLLFDPQDVADMAAAMEKLWLDEQLRLDLSAKGRVRSALNTWDRAAKTYLDIYGQALARWNASAAP